MKVSRLFVFVLAGFFTAIAEQSTFSQPVAEPFRQSVAVATNPVTVKKIADAKEYIAENRWEEAVKILSEVSSEEKHTLIPVSNGRFVNSRQYANLLLTGLPQKGLSLYRRKVDPQAEKWFQAGMKNRDPAMMLRIVQQSYASRYGDDALLALGRWAWEKGDLPAARRYWQQIILPVKYSSNEINRETLRYPDSNLNIPLIEARCILCDLVSGNLGRAHRVMLAFKKRFPKSRGTIAGKTGQLIDLLEGIEHDAKKWSFTKSGNGSPTFGGANNRSHVFTGDLEMGKALWSRQLNWRNPSRSDETLRTKRNRHAACFPVVVDGMVIVGLSDRVYVYDLHTGKPAFPTAAEEKASPEEKAVIYPEVPGERSSLPIRPSLGIVRYTVTVHKGRLYARLGSSVTGRAKHEVRAPRSELVSYILDRETGRLAWKISSQMFGLGWEFEGSPVISDGRLFVAMRKRFPETQTFVACFESQSGKLIWKQHICTAIAAPGDEQNHISHSLLTLSNDTVFFATHLGAIAALNQTDGTLKWVMTYPTVQPERLSDMNNPYKTGLTPAVFHQGVLVVAPSDSQKLLGIDAETGLVRWQRSLRGGVRNVLGVSAGRLIVSGNQLWAINLQTGGSLWNLGYEDPAGYGFGRGLLAGEFIFWPLREELLLVRSSNGFIVRRIAIRKVYGGRGGNLLMSGRSLIVAEPDRLVIYGSPREKRSLKNSQ